MRFDRRIRREDRRAESGTREAAPVDEDARRIRTVPVIGPIVAGAFPACAPEMEGFTQGRDFAARPALVPERHSTGGRLYTTYRDTTVAPAFRNKFRKFLI